MSALLTYKSSKEGIGAQQQRILSILAVSKVHGYRYVHRPITVGHNYDNEPHWDDTWDAFFNIKQHSMCIDPPSEAVYIERTGIILNDPSSLLPGSVAAAAVVPLTTHALSLMDNNPNLYYGSIIQEAREVYDATPKPLILQDRTKTNIVIHYRTYNPHDDVGGGGIEPGGYRHVSQETYVKLVKTLNRKYTNHVIHIYTQSSAQRDQLASMPNSNIVWHVDTNTFQAFHHMVIADVLIMAKSSFSYVAGMYNSNNVYYFDFWHSPLKTWHNVNSLLSV